MKTKLADVKTSELKSKPVSNDLQILTSAKNGNDFLDKLVCEELEDEKQGAEYCQVCGELYPCASARETNETYPTYWSDR